MAVLRVLAAVFRNPELRRVELAFVAFNGAEYATWIAMLVFAYEQGGATTAGLVAVAQLVPAGICAPFAAMLSDRRGPAWMLPQSYRAQALTMGATALALFADAPPVLIYAFAATAATAVTFTRPAQSALLPGLARSPEELTASNVVSGWIESVSVFGSTRRGRVLLAISGPGTVFAVMAGVALAGGSSRSAFPAPWAPHETRRARWKRPLPGSGCSRAIGTLGSSSASSARSSSDRSARRPLCRPRRLGALGIGESGAGYLNAAFGAGRRARDRGDRRTRRARHLARPLLAGVAVWAVALWALGAYRAP